MTPAMAAGATNRLWEIMDIVELIEKDKAEAAAERKEQQDWNGLTP